MSRLHDMGGRFGDGPIPIPRKKNNEIENICHALPSASESKANHTDNKTCRRLMQRHFNAAYAGRTI